MEEILFNNPLNRVFINQECFVCKELFQKELTPSDVGKLNRLVIPKRPAVNHLPQITGAGKEDVQLVFLDSKRKSWKFRYCYWKSSQSFVFTRGWTPFVREKNLKTNDVIMFYKCEYREGVDERKAFYMIDFIYSGEDGNLGNTNLSSGSAVTSRNEDLQLQFGSSLGSGLIDRRIKKEEEELIEAKVEKKSIKLFGVYIHTSNC